MADRSHRRAGKTPQRHRDAELTELRAVSARFHALVSGERNMLAEFDVKGRFTWLHPQKQAALGYAPEELVGTFVLDWVHPDDRGAAGESLTRTLDTGSAVHGDYRFRHRDGRWVWLETTANIFHGADGEPRILAISRDVSERRALLERREHELRERGRGAHMAELKGVIPICTHCQQVREASGRWRSLESYVAAHSRTRFSHSLCESCLEDQHPDRMRGS